MRYDSLQLRAEKRFLGSDSRIGGLPMVFSYTFSKAFDMSHLLNNRKLAEDPVRCEPRP